MTQLSLSCVPSFDRDDLAQWHTPAWLARRVVRWAGIGPGLRVLEPGAGGGNITCELVEAGAVVTAVEVDPAWAHVCRSRCPGASVHVGDFLLWGHGGREFDLAIANPPYDGGLDSVFLAEMFWHAPRVVAILRTHALHGVERFDRVWRHVDVAGLAFCVRRPKFGSGEQSDTAKHEFCVVDARRRGTWSGSTRVEWWE